MLSGLRATNERATGALGPPLGRKAQGRGDRQYVRDLGMCVASWRCGQMPMVVLSASFRGTGLQYCTMYIALTQCIARLATK